MFDHVGIQVADVEASLGFYTSVFAPLGFHEVLRFETPGGPVVGLAGREGGPAFWLSPNECGAAREDHLAFRAADAAEVDAVHTAALAAGAEVLHAPRIFPEYHDSYYAVFVRDPDGHNVEAVTHEHP
ncbi:MAG: VOC family protein [Nocardioides sp.]|nr:VOC family protein [Nocardioides sp.]